MAKEKKKLELAPVAEIPGADALVARVAKRRKRLEAAAAKATSDGVLDASQPAYRAARKRVKRAQRRLRRERERVARVRAKAGTKAPAAESAG